MATLSAFCQWAINQGWQVERLPAGHTLPTTLANRYPAVPPPLQSLLGQFALLATPTDTSWFLCADAFDAAADITWPYNAFEAISLEAAEGDQALTDEVTAFWDGHLPFLFSVARGYQFYAIRLADGVIVCGEEPEFEEVSAAAPSFEAFLDKIMDGTLSLG